MKRLTRPGTSHDPVIVDVPDDQFVPRHCACLPCRRDLPHQHIPRAAFSTFGANR